MKFRKKNIIASIVFLFFVAGCKSISEPEINYQFNEMTLNELNMGFNSKNRETFIQDINNKPFKIRGKTILYYLKQVLILDEEKFEKSGRSSPSMNNCLQLLMPSKLLDKLPLGKILEYNIYGSFLFLDVDFYKPAADPAESSVSYQIKGVDVDPFCALKTHLFFYVEKLEPMS